jgi:hypothetical protein
VTEGPDLLQCDAWADPRVQVDAPPGHAGLEEPPNLVPALLRVATEVGLDRQSASQAAKQADRLERMRS